MPIPSSCCSKYLSGKVYNNCISSVIVKHFIIGLGFVYQLYEEYNMKSYYLQLNKQWEVLSKLQIRDIGFSVAHFCLCLMDRVLGS